ncbi:MAG: Ig-like domain-containing protein [Clostridia bacterium]|nr:Ig-like domain-containing protein [Clostridia bacterium]
MKRLLSILLILFVLMPYTTASSAGDTKAPVATSCFPNDKQTKVDTGSIISVAFSEAINKGKNFSGIILSDQKKKQIKIISSIQKNKLTVKPSSRLNNNTRYVVTIPTDAIVDYAGNRMSKTLSFSFTTIQSDNTGNSAAASRAYSTEFPQPDASVYPSPFEADYLPAMDNPEVVADFADIEVTAGKGPVIFLYPYEQFVARTLIVRNKGTSDAVVEYDASIDIPNYEAQLFINHPQPSVLYLKPGESMPIRLIYTMQTGGPSVPEWNKGDKISAPMKIELDIRKEKAMSAEKKQVVLSNIVEVASRGGRDFREYETNAEIYGKVIDASSGKAIPNVNVRVDAGTSRVDVRSDSQGKFRVPVYAFRYSSKNFWREFAISVNPGGPNIVKGSLGEARAVVAPKKGEKVNVTLALKTLKEIADYSVEKVIDIGLQGYSWDSTADGSIMATVPFHTAMRPADLYEKCFLTVFNCDGKLLWKYQIYGETPTVDVSKDGSLIATTRQSKPKEGQPYSAGGVPVVLDKNGKVIREFPLQKTEYWWGISADNVMEVQISDDNKYLAAGDSMGGVFLYEIETGHLVWKAFTNGQVRKMLFDSVNNKLVLYSSSGDGYLRAFDVDGNLLWKTYTDSWATDMEMSKETLIITTKCNRSAIHLIDKSNGKYIWSYPVENRGSGVHISPDGSFIWYGHNVGGGSVGLRSAVFNAKGAPLFDMDGIGQAAAITADSQYIAVTDDHNVALYDRYGQRLWSKQIADKGHGGSMNHLLWISPDGKRIVAGLNNNPNETYAGQIYFLKGGIK